MTKKQIRYGVVGLGHIAQVAVLPAFKQAKSNSLLTTLVTDDPKKAKVLSKKYKAPFIYDYGDFEKMLEDKVVDALYICLPNPMHVEFVVKALKAGVHVLCEKPLALTESDCLRMMSAAESTGTRLMTAYRLHFEPANLKALQLCKTGKIGELRYFSSNFSFQVIDPDNIRLKKNGGGPLWDIGIYCVNAARTLFQAEPLEVFAYSLKGNDKRFSEVEESAAVVMKFPDDRTASFTCSFGSDTAGEYDVVGTKGLIRLESAYEYAGPRKLIFKKDGKVVKSQSFKKIDQFAPEIIYFSDCVIKNKEPEPSGREGLADVRVITAIHKSIEIGRPVSLDPNIQYATGPDGNMVFRKKGHKEPDIVNVTAPHS